MDPEPENEPSKLLSLPEEIFGNVLDAVDYKSLICLRKVCKPIRFLIHQLKPDIHCAQLNLVVSDSGCSQELIFDLDDDGSIIWIEYHEEDPNGCALVFEDSIKILENRSCYDVFEEDSEMVWPLLKSEVQELNVKFYGGDLGRFLAFLKTNLQSLKDSGAPLRIKCLSVELAMPEMCLIRDILKLVDPESLETLSISHRLDKARWPHENVLYGASLMKTEQWARAKVLETRNISWMEPLHHFAGFDRVVTRVGIVDTMELVALIGKLTHSPTFESYQITYRECEFPFWPLYLDTPIPSDRIVEFFKNEIIEIHEANNKEHQELGIEDDNFMTGIEFFEHLKTQFTGVDWWDQDVEVPVREEIRAVENPENEEEEEEIPEDVGENSEKEEENSEKNAENAEKIEENSEEMEQKPEETERNLEKNAGNIAKNIFDYGSEEEYEGILVIKADSPRGVDDDFSGNFDIFEDDEADSDENAENNAESPSENAKNDDGIADLVQKYDEVFADLSRNNSEKSDDDGELSEDENYDDDDSSSSIASEDNVPQPEPPGVFPAMVWFFKMHSRPDQLLCVKHCKWENMFFFQLFPKKQAPFNAVIHELGKRDEKELNRWTSG